MAESPRKTKTIGSRKGFQFKVKSLAKTEKIQYEDFEEGSKQNKEDTSNVVHDSNKKSSNRLRSSLKRTRQNDDVSSTVTSEEAILEQTQNTSKPSRKSTRLTPPRELKSASKVISSSSSKQSSRSRSRKSTDDVSPLHPDIATDTNDTSSPKKTTVDNESQNDERSSGIKTSSRSPVGKRESQSQSRDKRSDRMKEEIEEVSGMKEKDEDKIETEQVKDNSKIVSEQIMPKKKIVKSHYPRIPVDPELIFTSAPHSRSMSHPSSTTTTCSSSSPLSQSHKDLLVHIIKEICEVEKEGLKAHFNSLESRLHQTSNMSYGDTGVLDSLLSVLSQLTEAVAESCPKEVQFEPELSAVRREQLKEMNESLRVLQSRSLCLETHLQTLKQTDGQDISSIEITGRVPEPVVDDGQEDMCVAIAKESLDLYTTSVAKDAETMLLKIAEDIGVVGEHVEETRQMMTNSRKLQGAVYERFNQIRFKGQSVSRDPKEIIKTLQTME